MTRVILVLSTFLSIGAVDLNLLRARPKDVGFLTGISEEWQEREQAKKRFLNLNRGVIPPWLKKAKLKLRQKVKWYSAKSRNVRDLDHKKLRRKCINF